jgi:rare lipoprotein A
MMRIYLFLPLSLILIGVASCATMKPQYAPSRPAAVAATLPATAMTPAPTTPAPPTPPPAEDVQPSPPVEQAFFTQEGVASLYGKAHRHRATAAGEHFDRTDFTAAHRTLAFGTVVRVTDMRNGKSVKVRINDRGPRVKGRVIDLSLAAARALGFRDGLVRVRVEAFASDQPPARVPPEIGRAASAESAR